MLISENEGVENMTYIPGSGGGGGTVSTSSDVALNNVAGGEVLTYDAGLQKWKNAKANTAASKAVVLYNSSTSSYPARPADYGSVEWIGPVDPGAAALQFDTWLNTAA